jgi:hypothetical protein
MFRTKLVEKKSEDMLVLYVEYIFISVSSEVYRPIDQSTSRQTNPQTKVKETAGHAGSRGLSLP